MATILFLHGWGGGEDSFAPIRAYFERDHKCVFVTFDCSPKTVLTLDDYALNVEKILTENGVKRCCIIAHSFGARIAVLLAVRNPDLVEKMVLTGAAGLKTRFNLRVFLKIRLHRFKTRVLKMKPRGGSPDYRKLTPAGKVTFQNIIRRDLARQIRTLEIPTLLIYGSRDKSTPPYMGKRWTKLQKSSTLLMYKRDGHFCFVTSPARFIRDADNFFRRDS